MINYYTKETYNAIAKFLGFKQVGDTDYWIVNGKELPAVKFVRKIKYILLGIEKIQKFNTLTTIADDDEYGNLVIDTYEILFKSVYISFYKRRNNDDYLPSLYNRCSLVLFEDDYKSFEEKLYKIVAFFALNV